MYRRGGRIGRSRLRGSRDHVGRQFRRRAVLGVPLRGRRHHVGRQFRRRAVLVPPTPLQPVPHILLVERRRRPARPVLVGRPEPRAVRRQHLVDQDQVAVRQGAPLQLGVGHDHPPARGVSGRLAVHEQGAEPQPGGPVLAHRLGQPLERHVLVVPAVGLRRRRKNRLRQLVPLPQPGRQLHPAHRPGGPVLLPPGPGQVAAGHALERHHRRLPHQHGAADQLLAAERRRQVRRVSAQQVVRVAEAVQPEGGEGGEDVALARDAGRQHPVEGAQPVGGHDGEGVRPEVVHVPHLAAAAREAGDVGGQ